MEITGEYRIGAARARVWAALNDPEILRQCIPGCRSLEQESPESLRATVQAQLGPIKANLQGTVLMSDLDPPAGYKLSWQGSGGAAGFARGSAEVFLSDAGHETILRYKALCTVGGKLAQIGSRLIDTTAKKLSDEFFGQFASLLEGDAGAGEPTPAIAVVAAGQETLNPYWVTLAAIGAGAAAVAYAGYRFLTPLIH
ncbi:hypothetical protein SRS16CHR_01342 [Variovorax sp. SRS16]|uniref:CoxG family protein n=1 Tax=Variovorax sp. SRS16 TaxID=282217 RepID=UPI0013171BD1|nr:carbon monoxide dehydrogenase subunit G [Variovorax sp. SRS16]VTU15021.1 hypothetical protein SRS16CHR_01342 [Variovorax sp. SRS16]